MWMWSTNSYKLSYLRKGKKHFPVWMGQKSVGNVKKTLPVPEKAFRRKKN